MAAGPITSFIGDIAGQVDNGHVSNCAALNPAITGYGFETEFGRVAGANSGTLNNNIAWDGMSAEGGVSFWGLNTGSGVDGEDIDKNNATTQATYQNAPLSGLGWDFNSAAPVWKWGSSGYDLPVLNWQTEMPLPATPAHLLP